MWNWNQSCVFVVWWVNPERASLCFDSLNRNSGSSISRAVCPLPTVIFALIEPGFHSKQRGCQNIITPPPKFPFVLRHTPLSPQALFPFSIINLPAPSHGLFVGNLAARFPLMKYQIWVFHKLWVHAIIFSSVLRLATAQRRGSPTRYIFGQIERYLRN